MDIKKKNTIVEVATDAKVSIATVSRALNNDKRVSDQTRRKVLESARKLKYIPNISAKELVLGTSKTIGLLLSSNTMVNVYISGLLSTEFAQHDFRLITFSSENSFRKQDAFLKDLLYRRVQGLIVFPIPGDYSFLNAAIQANIPVVILNRFVKDLPISHISMDARVGICECVDQLTQKGRKIFFQLTSLDIAEGFERRNAFSFACKANNLRYKYNPIIPVGDTIRDGYQSTIDILLHYPQTDALICSSDYVAAGAIRAVIDQGRKVPEEISVVGFYNSDISQYFCPRISTIDADLFSMTKTACRHLLDSINSATHEQVNFSLPTRFESRESS